MTKSRKKFEAASEARVALKALREVSTVPGLAKRHGVHPNPIYVWKKQVLDNLASLFARGASASVDRGEGAIAETAKLYSKIGQFCQHGYWHSAAPLIADAMNGARPGSHGRGGAMRSRPLNYLLSGAALGSAELHSERSKEQNNPIGR